MRHEGHYQDIVDAGPWDGVDGGKLPPGSSARRQD
jgi:hypothetical protein